MVLSTYAERCEEVMLLIRLLGTGQKSRDFALACIGSCTAGGTWAHANVADFGKIHMGVTSTQ